MTSTHSPESKPTQFLRSKAAEEAEHLGRAANHLGLEWHNQKSSDDLTDTIYGEKLAAYRVLNSLNECIVPGYAGFGWRRELVSPERVDFIIDAEPERRLSLVFHFDNFRFYSRCDGIGVEGIEYDPESDAFLVEHDTSAPHANAAVTHLLKCFFEADKRFQALELGEPEEDEPHWETDNVFFHKTVGNPASTSACCCKACKEP